MRIGILPVLNREGGGIYQYSLTMLESVAEAMATSPGDELVVFAEATAHPAVAGGNGTRWEVHPALPPSARGGLWRAVRSRAADGPVRDGWRWLRWQLHGRWTLPDPEVVRRRPEISAWYREAGVELMIYPGPNSQLFEPFEIGVPYVLAIHDLQHRLQPEFPEVSAYGQREWREYQFRNGARHATLLIADSETGKEDILRFYGSYGVTPDRVRVLPFLPASYLASEVPEGEGERVRSKYRLPDRYFFYPSQFWPHKNHERIVRALGLLKRYDHVEIPIVFCGAATERIRRRTLRRVLRLARRLGIRDQVRHLGYVGDRDMHALYAGATALVMPTFFGPTNIPIIEAWGYGCPVITSDIRGIREQVGDAALLVDPRSAESIAAGVHRIWRDQDFRDALAGRGRERLAAYPREAYCRRLKEIIEEAKARVRSLSATAPRSTGPLTHAAT